MLSIRSGLGVCMSVPLFRLAGVGRVMAHEAVHHHDYEACTQGVGEGVEA